jgi:hypothetical protein
MRVDHDYQKDGRLDKIKQGDLKVKFYCKAFGYDTMIKCHECEEPDDELRIIRQMKYNVVRDNMQRIKEQKKREL